ncbi:MAG: hypothetical protein AB7K86_01425 [Rhodospirillales bacterium]
MIIGKRLTVVALSAALLAASGCAGKPPQQACREYGFKEGTDAFAACVQKEVLAEKERSAIIASGARRNASGNPNRSDDPPARTCTTFGKVTTCN